jgi:hypothetical protein
MDRVEHNLLVSLVVLPRRCRKRLKLDPMRMEFRKETEDPIVRNAQTLITEPLRENWRKDKEEPRLTKFTMLKQSAALETSAPKTDA